MEEVIHIHPDLVAGLLARARRAEDMARHAAEQADDLGDDFAALEHDTAMARACVRAVLAGTATDTARAALGNWAYGFTPCWPSEVTP